MEEVDTFYVFNISGGIICTACKVPVRLVEFRLIPSCIFSHEMQKTHTDTKRRATSDAERKAVAFNFTSYIDKCTVDVQHCLPSIQSANQKILSLVGTPKMYAYCSFCKVLTANETNHNSKKCRSFLRTQKYGVKPQDWVHSNPTIIIVSEFDITDNCMLEKYMCQKFLDTWYSKQLDNTKTDQVEAVLHQQAILFHGHRQNMTVLPIDNKKTPNLYATTLAWDKALAGCQLTDINNLKNSDRFGKFEDGLDAVLQRFDEALWYGLSQCQSLQPMHPVLCEMGTKDGGKTKKPLHLEKGIATWKRYFEHVKTIVLILFRISSKKKSKQHSGLPVVEFTLQQEASMDKCKTWNSSTNPIHHDSEAIESHILHLGFLLSLVDQRIGFQTCNCPLIAALAIFSVDRNAFVSVQNLSPCVAGVLTVYRMLLAYDCIEKHKDSSDDMEDCAIKHSIQYLHINDNTYPANPLRELIKCVTCIKTESMNLSSQGIMAWSADKETITYRGTFSISMGEFTNRIRSTLDEANALLLQILECSTLPSIPWDTVVDNPNDRSYGFSFLSDERNQHWVRNDYYLRSMIQKKLLWWDSSSALVSTAGRNNEGRNLFAKLVEAFRSKLLGLLHVTGGKSPRGTEMTNITFENTIESIRNIFIERGCVHIRTLYHKGMIQSQK